MRDGSGGSRGSRGRRWRARLASAAPAGSRARGDAGPRSDWDFGFPAGDELDAAALHATLTVALATDAVDLVDLRHASALLRFHAARDGVVLFERTAGEFQRFQLEAVDFWCDAGQIIRAAYEDVLAALGDAPGADPTR